MSSRFDPVALFKDVASEAAKTAASEGIKELLTVHAVPAILIEVSKESAKAMVGSLAGPMLGVLLKVIDPTQDKLDAILKAPYEVGILSAKRALQIKPTSEGDIRLREELLHSAIHELEKAYSYAGSLKKADQQAKIRMTQALIAKNVNAPAVALSYANSFLAEVREQKRSREFQLQRNGENTAYWSRKIAPSDREIVDMALKTIEAKDVLAGGKDAGHFNFEYISEDWMSVRDEMIRLRTVVESLKPIDLEVTLAALGLAVSRVFLDGKIAELRGIELFWKV